MSYLWKTILDFLVGFANCTVMNRCEGPTVFDLAVIATVDGFSSLSVTFFDTTQVVIAISSPGWASFALIFCVWDG